MRVERSVVSCPEGQVVFLTRNARVPWAVVFQGSSPGMTVSGAPDPRPLAAVERLDARSRKVFYNCERVWVDDEAPDVLRVVRPWCAPGPNVNRLDRRAATSWFRRHQM